MADIKQYVNLDPNKPDELKEIKPERAGRNILVTAKINKKVEGVPIVFEIKSGSKNVFPSLDKSNFSKNQRKYLAELKNKMPGLQMPMSAKRKVITNEDGEASIEFKLSSFGGDEFEVIAYVRKSGGKKGKELKSDKYTVWRRIYYQVSRFEAGKIGVGYKGSLPDIPKLDWAPVKKEFEERQHNIELIDDSSKDLIPRNSNILLKDNDYADHKVCAKNGYKSKRQPVTMRAVLVNMIASYETRNLIYNIKSSGNVNVDTPKPLWKDLSIKRPDDCILEAKWHFSKGKDKSWKNFDKRYLGANGPKKIMIRFDLMPANELEAQFGKNPVDIKIKLKLKYLSSSTNGRSWYNAIWIANENMHRGQRTPEDKQATTIHETGHFIDMVPPSQNSTWYEKHGHTGNHCSQGLLDTDKPKASYKGLNGTCVMFGESALSRKNVFCSECDPSVRKSAVKIKFNIPSSW